MPDVRKEFVDVGTSRPVRLTQEQKAGLLEVIEHWGGQASGELPDGLPTGIFALRIALRDDLHDAGAAGGVTEPPAVSR